MNTFPELTPITDPQNPTPTAVSAEDHYALTRTQTDTTTNHVKTIQLSHYGTPTQILADMHTAMRRRAHLHKTPITFPAKPTAEDTLRILRATLEDGDTLNLTCAREYFYTVLRSLGEKDQDNNTTWGLALIPSYYSTVSSRPGYVRYIVRAELSTRLHFPDAEPKWFWFTLHLGRRFYPGKRADLSPHLSYVDFGVEIPGSISEDDQRLEQFRQHLLAQAPKMAKQAATELGRRYGVPAASLRVTSDYDETFSAQSFHLWGAGRIRRLAQLAEESDTA
ncbi:hypothetical protein HMPREF2942_00380 [Rothia sp. HMSC071C12]|jgi:hypothetical protein|uniref:hypothetical protein n=1 Tax=Rothia sp. HMSC071C12 TaxID=1739446 RepID=UPI0008A13F48|nr:hypothetical protein [Rothia sp. HMSC071C12]OFQ33376.1 hypothetical protein HMPREF2942_00380 [Rothia sp. HMSC071C12]